MQRFKIGTQCSILRPFPSAAPQGSKGSRKKGGANKSSRSKTWLFPSEHEFPASLRYFKIRFPVQSSYIGVSPGCLIWYNDSVGTVRSAFDFYDIFSGGKLVYGCIRSNC